MDFTANELKHSAKSVSAFDQSSRTVSARTTLPLVSVIMPAYNSARYIAHSIESVLEQSHRRLELIITDDASSDETAEILKRFAKRDERIELIFLPKNQGAAAARNASLSRAKGQFIAFLDSDDLWEAHKLERQLAFMQANQLSVSFTAYEVIDQGGQSYAPAKIVDMRAKHKVSYQDMLKKMATMGCSTVMLDQRQFDAIQMPLIRTGEDYSLWLSLLRDGRSARCCREVLTRYRKVPGSISSNKLITAYRQYTIYRRFEKVPPLRACYYMYFYAKNALWRK